MKSYISDVTVDACIKGFKRVDFFAVEGDILECYAVTGDYDYIIKICAADMEHLEEKLLRLKGQKGVMKSHTMLSLMEHKFSPTALPDIDGEKG